MAVEIPVVIDIDGAFDEAAKRVDSAIRPFKKKIEDSTAGLKLTVGIDEFGGRLEKTVKQLTEIKTLLNGKVKLGASLREVSSALEDAKNRYAQLETLRSKGAAVSSQRLNSLREAIIILTQELEIRQGIANKVSEEAARQIQVKRAIEEGNYALIQEANTIAQLESKISALTGKLKNIDPHSVEWKATAKEISSATAELGKYQDKLKSIQGKTGGAGSINRMAEDMRKLEAQWNNMSSRAKFDKDGNLSKSAQRVVDKYKALAEQAEKTGKSLREMTKNPKEKLDSLNTTAEKTSSVLRNLTSYAASFVSVWSAVNFIKRIRETTAEFELQEVALGGILQNARMAHTLFEQIKTAAVESPFFVKDLVTYTKQLSAYRIETDKLFDVTMQLADVSAGLGVDMNRLILAYGQVRAASVLRGQELRQFTEAGVPLVELLADKFTELRGTMVSTADVFKLISERAVPFSMIEEIFNDMTSAGGMFYKMQEKQAETLAGRWNNLKDSIAIAMDEMGRTEEMRELFNAMIDLAKRFMKGITNLVKNFKTLAITFGVVKVAMALFGNVTRSAYMQEKLLARQTKRTNVEMTNWWASLSVGEKVLRRFGTILPNVTRAVRKLWAAFIANPIGIITAAVGTLISAFEIFGKETEEHQDIGDIGSFIANAEKQYNEVNSLAETYDRLTAKQELNEREQKQLTAVTNELAKAYRGKAIEIDEVTGKIRINTKEVRKLSEEEKAARKLQLQAQKERIEGYNKSNEARLKYLSTRLRLDREQEVSGKSTAEIARERARAYAEAGLTSKDITKIEKWLDDGDVLDAMNQVTEWLDTGREQLKEIEEAFNTIVSSDRGLNGWQEAIVDVQDEYSKTGAIFSRLTDEQLKNYSSLNDALVQFAKDWKDNNKQIETSKSSLKALETQFNALNMLDTVSIKGADIYRSIGAVKKELELSEANKEFFDRIFALFGVDPEKLLKKGAGGHAYVQPAYISAMNEQLKFMKDFEKGYRDLKKYIGGEGAIAEELGIMGARGKALGLGTEEQKRAATDLVGWYKDVLDKTAEKMRNMTGLRGSPQELLSYQITGSSDRDKMIRDFQKLLQSIFDAQTDINTAQLKKNIEDALNRAQDEIKRSETARNFFNDILETTGDLELATQISFGLYGGAGQEFQERIRKAFMDIMQNSQFKGDVFSSLFNAFESGDMVAFNKILDDLGDDYDEVAKKLRQLASDYTNFYGNQAKDLLKSLEAAKTYGEKRVKIERDMARREEEISNMRGLSEEKREQLRLRNKKKAAEEAAKAEYEAFKDSPMYVAMFENLDGASTRMLENMRSRILAVKEEWKDLSATELKELQSRLDDINSAMANRNPIKVFAQALRERRDIMDSGFRSRRYDEINATLRRAEADAEVKTLDMILKELEVLKEKYGTDSKIVEDKEKEVDAQQKITDKAIETANAAEKQALRWNEVAANILKAAEGVSKYAEEISSIVDSTQKVFDTFASSKNSEIFGNYANGIKETLSGISNMATGAAKIAAGDYIGGSISLISGIADTVSGIWGTASNERIRRYNERIEELDRSLNRLQHSYSNLEKAMAKSFGSDYVYNQQAALDNLEAQQKAYLAQAEAEEKKGKKSDKDKVEEYKQAARDVADQIDEMRSKLSEFFTGTDLTSAAKDFASSWIEAYKSFSSTTGAIKEKFNDLVQEMVTNSLAAQMVQSILKPWFEQIDAMAQSGGMLDAREIAQIASETGGYVDLIDTILRSLMDELMAAGYNIRQQTTSATGIKRDYASASEESINALTAGINTQNFYMSFVPPIAADVAAIREALTGESSVRPSSVNVSSSGFGDEVFRSQMIRIDENLIEIRALLRSVVAPRGTTVSTHSVSVKYN